ncbi:MAG: response regulator [Roseiflexaceae bacterium]
MTRILVVDDSPINLKLVSAALTPVGYEIVTAQNGREALQRVEGIEPDLVILDVMMPELNGYEVCRRLRQRANLGQLPIMMLTANDSLEERINGLEAGADDYMSKPFEVPELQARVKALLRRAAPVQPVATTRQGKVIAVFSLRGGIGVSTLATNLAAGLAQLWGQPTALVDLVLASGQSALMLNAPLRHTWADLSEASVGEIDSDLLDSVMLSHPCGTRVLAAAVRPEQSELISAEKVSHVISLLKERYEYVVLDLPHDFSDTTLAGLDVAHHVLLMMAPELASVRAMACAVEVFDNLDYASDRISLVLNATFERGGLARKDIENTLKRPIAMSLPYMPEALVSAINRGVPPVLDLAHKPAGAVFEEFSLFVSKDEHRTTKPAHPTEAWLRLAQRQQRRRAS